MHFWNSEMEKFFMKDNRKKNGTQKLVNMKKDVKGLNMTLLRIYFLYMLGVVVRQRRKY